METIFLRIGNWWRLRHYRKYRLCALLVFGQLLLICILPWQSFQFISKGTRQSVTDEASEISADGFEKRFPSVLIIGFRKAGTGAFGRFLNLHPDVVLANTEPHFFDWDYEKGIDWYRERMPFSKKGQITIDRTPNYIFSQSAPERAHEFNSSFKLLLIVRDPIERAVSDYLQTKERYFENGNTNYYGSFEEMITEKFTGKVNTQYGPIRRSLYSMYLNRWLAYFSLSQIHIVDGQVLTARPWEELRKVETFLGLRHKLGPELFRFNQTRGFFCYILPSLVGTARGTEHCMDSSKGRQHPRIDRKSLRRLKQFFSPFNKEFFLLTGREFPWLRKSGLSNDES